MKIDFSPPFINDKVKEEVLKSLDSGWITTGPQVRKLEEQIKEATDAPEVVCVNSWTSGAILVLKWLGVGEGDEVIIPAYTYAATAMSVIHAGARPIMVDVGEDFNIAIENIEKAITPRTKAIIPVDFAGWPCDYDGINDLVSKKRELFVPQGEVQEKLGRILVVADAAHSIGAMYKGKSTGVLTDITIFSLHAVKNVTTAEGGAICLNLPEPFNNDELYRTLRCYSLNGQTKDALAKSKAGSWKYDIIYPGLKINLPDVLAAIGVGQMEVYLDDILPKRKEIFEQYNSFFEEKDWAIEPHFHTEDQQSSCHLYPLRIKGATEEQRDLIIQGVGERGVAVNVHFQPLPRLSLFKQMGYQEEAYPMAMQMYTNEISLPIYPQLSQEHIAYIVKVVSETVENVLK